MRSSAMIGEDYKKDIKLKKESKQSQFWGWFKKTAASILRQKGILTYCALYEADHQIASLYQKYSKGRKCYVVSEDGDFYFMGIPQIKKIYLQMEEKEYPKETK